MTEQEQHPSDKLSIPKAHSHITINISRKLYRRKN